jgi:hypothetical protein
MQLLMPPDYTQDPRNISIGTRSPGKLVIHISDPISSEHLIGTSHRNISSQATLSGAFMQIPQVRQQCQTSALYMEVLIWSTVQRSAVDLKTSGGNEDSK